MMSCLQFVAPTDKSLVDQELVAKLDSELAVEKEIRDSEQLPPNIQDFLDTSSFKVSDQVLLSLSWLIEYSLKIPLAWKKSS